MNRKHSWHLRAPLAIVLLIWIGTAWVAVGLIGWAIWWAFGYPPLDGPLLGRERFLLITTPVALATGTVVMIRVVITARDHELSKVNQEETQRHNVEQRITDLHIRATELLESDKAHIRVAALHDLERLAQENPSLRQSIVDEICAYLQNPYEPPRRNPDPPLETPSSTPTLAEPRSDSGRPGRRAGTLTLLLLTTAVDYLNDRITPPPPANEEPQRHDRDTNKETSDVLSERRVRLKAQAILARHLRPSDPDRFWAGIDLNLSEAVLENFDLSDCRIRDLDLSWANLYGRSDFQRLHIQGRAFFVKAHFRPSGTILFQGAIFDGPMNFNASKLVDLAVDTFDGAKARVPAKLPEGQRHLLPRGRRLEDVNDDRDFALLVWR